MFIGVEGQVFRDVRHIFMLNVSDLWIDKVVVGLPSVIGVLVGEEPAYFLIFRSISQTMTGRVAMIVPANVKVLT